MKPVTFLFGLCAWGSLSTWLLLPPVAASGAAVSRHIYSANEPLSQDSWITQAWTAKEHPFVSARKNLETTVQTKHNALQLAANLDISSGKHPKDAIVLFRWGLATYYASQTESIVWKPPMVERLLTALSIFPSPHSEEFARMRFLIEARYNGVPTLKQIGLRLLKHNPNDDAVKSSMYPVLNIIGNPGDGRLAVTFARELIAEHPNNPKWYAMLGAAYYDISIREPTISNYSASIQAYQRYLKLASPDDPFREQAGRLIKELEKTMPKH